MVQLSLLNGTALRSAAFAGLALIATPAWAQETPATDTAQATPVDATVPDTTANDQPADDGAIVVTGSRIRRSTFNSPSPIAVIDPEIAEKRGVIDTAEMLMSSPIASGSSQVTSAISSNFVTDGGPGASTISLRGLGANRTLVLLNGRRAGPAGTRGAVSAFDLNVLPQSIIQQVQIEKDGASSVYGSDAVAGVVNLITKTKTKGLELTAFGSVPQEEGGEQYRVSGAWGTEWGGSLGGHVMFAADYYRQKELAAGDRSYLTCPQDYVFDSSNKRIDITDPRTGKPRCAQLSWGQVYLYDYSSGALRTGRGGYSYPGENLGNYVPNLRPTIGLGVPSNFYQMGYDPASAAIDHLDHPFYQQDSVIPETKRLTFYGEGSIHISEHIEAYAEGLWNRRETHQNASRQFWNYIYTEDWGGPATGFTGEGFISPTPVTDHFDSSQRVDYWRAVGGLRGDFGSLLKGWTWDGFVQYSKSAGTYTQDQIYDDAVTSPDFFTFACQPGEVTAVRGAPCVDVRWTDPEFLAGNPNAAERAYLFGVDTGRTSYKQLNAEFSVTGPIVTLPAGDLAVAAGVAWRRDTILDHPGDIVCGPVADDPYGCVNNAWGVTSSGVTAGHNITEEAFAEVDLPLIHNTPFVQSFTLSGSGRYTQFKATRDEDGATASDKNNWTYKVGANWQVNDFLRFRGSWGTSYRAPALFEQFLANQSSFGTRRTIDPCIGLGTKIDNGSASNILVANCAAAGITDLNFTGGSASNVEVLSGGGLGVVKAETSTAKTASVILMPKFGFLPRTRINLAVDYFNIEVKGEISKLGASTIVGRCYNSNFFPNDPLCAQFDRDPTTLAITQVRDQYININEQKNEGIDVTANIAQDLGSWGKLSATAEMTWQTVDYIALYSTTRESFNGEDGEPIWTGAFNVSWEKDSFSAYYGLNVVGGTSDVSDYIADYGDTCLTSAIYPNGFCDKLRAKPVFYHSVSLTKELPHVQITLGVTNLFNTKPPRVSVYNNSEITTVGQSVFSSQYDLLGRRGFLSIKSHF
ncbi:TonB-dependent receptor [Sphingomonas sp. dw_22]|uniref:TonB-dependent receptor plug domain-containing protein n=1 Tax=Sphingomonas sp. dw_22 TaxID=2721175 RepID=UPI001BD2A15A|nr:TonB-dependent receptor [Sphingomonas sp. dw_22]